MKATNSIPADVPPVAIGGVGGSGTRLVAAIIRELGFHLGDDLNAANDNLWFTLLFKRTEILQCGDPEFELATKALVSALVGGRPACTQIEALTRRLAAVDRPQHPAAWLQRRCDSLLAAADAPLHGRPWGWKEPNTHVVIERLWQRLPRLRYVHVVRNGLQMAFSSNQNQVNLWGTHVLGDQAAATPARSLAYWCAVQRRMRQVLADNPRRMLWLDFDALCRAPRASIDRLRAFLGVEGMVGADTLAGIRRPARSHPGQPMAGLDANDLAYVQELGYALG